MVETNPRNEWYYVVDDEDGRHRAGPVPGETLVAMLSSGSISDATPVWREGMSDWVQAQTMVSDLHAEQWQILHPAREADETEPERPVSGTPRGDAGAAPPGPSEGVVLQETGAHTLRFSRARNAILVYTNDYHAGPLTLRKRDLLRLLLAMEESSGE